MLCWSLGNSLVFVTDGEGYHVELWELAGDMFVLVGGMQAVLRFICDAALDAAEKGSSRSPALKLFGAGVFELLQAVPRVRSASV